MTLFCHFFICIFTIMQAYQMKKLAKTIKQHAKS